MSFKWDKRDIIKRMNSTNRHAMWRLILDEMAWENNPGADLVIAQEGFDHYNCLILNRCV